MFIKSDSKALTILNERAEVAMRAMQGILANAYLLNHFENNFSVLDPNDVANDAVRYADALLKRLKERSDFE